MQSAYFLLLNATTFPHFEKKIHFYSFANYHPTRPTMLHQVSQSALVFFSSLLTLWLKVNNLLLAFELVASLHQLRAQSSKNIFEIFVRAPFFYRAPRVTIVTSTQKIKQKWFDSYNHHSGA
jgi:hypothetical protein